MSSSVPNEPDAARDGAFFSQRKLIRRCLIALTTLLWIIIAGYIVTWLAAISATLVIMIISIAIAFVVYPLVKLLARFLPRALAILIVYLGVLGLVVVLIYFVLLAAVAQLIALIRNIQAHYNDILHTLQPLVDRLSSLGVTPGAPKVSAQDLINHILAFAGGILPIVSNIAGVAITTIIITSLSIYFILDGGKALTWLRSRTPLRYRKNINFFLDTLNQTMGGFIRGQITLATVISIIVFIGLLLFDMPYAVLLTLLVFVFEFVPQIGSYISCGIIILLAFLIKGWQIGLGVTAFFGLVQGGLDGQVLAPRILGHSVGIHPIISLFALLVGAQLFGLLGALFAAPIAGIVRIILLAFWSTWKKSHSEQFPEETADNAVPRVPGKANETG